MYTELEAVNACLASMGEAPVLDLTVPHPYVPSAIATLRRHNKLVQSIRWWFNFSVVTLVPVGPSYTVAASLPAGALSIIGLQGNAYVLNPDGTVYDIGRGEQVTAPIDAVVLREIAFDQLPPEANVYVADCAILQFQSDYDGDSTRTQLKRENRTLSYTQLMAQHTRMMKTNLFSRVVSKLHDIRGDRPVLRGQE